MARVKPNIEVAPFYRALHSISPTQSMPTGPLTSTEQFALVESVLQVLLYDDAQSRPLGGNWTNELLTHALSASHPGLVASRGAPTLLAAWDEISGKLHQGLLRAGNVKTGELTDAQRSRLRMAPRLATACRCGSGSHIYVNDAKCPLYSNLRALDDSNKTSKEVNSRNDEHSDDAAAIEEAATKRKKLLDKNFQKDTLNVMEKAYKNRFVRVKTEQDAEDAEAVFVARMEAIQVSQCNQAIFAPSLAAVVLSAVAELEDEFHGKELSQMKPFAVITSVIESTTFASDTKKLETTVEENEGNAQNGGRHNSQPQSERSSSITPPSMKVENGDESSDDEDDDIPLAALGNKRSNETAVEIEQNLITKKHRGHNAGLRPQFLARMIQFISAKWGHVFQEPSHPDYAW